MAIELIREPISASLISGFQNCSGATRFFKEVISGIQNMVLRIERE